jgi:ferritin
MFSQIVLDEMNNQVKHEFYSAYLYLSMSAYCESQNLRGFAHWLKAQYHEEMAHGFKFYEFIFDRGGVVSLQIIEQPQLRFKGPTDIFEHVLEHEKKVTALIEHLMAVAVQEKDFAAQTFLQWFIMEQVEEEKHASEILDMLQKIGDSVQGLFMIDHQLGARKAG